MKDMLQQYSWPKVECSHPPPPPNKFDPIDWILFIYIIISFLDCSLRHLLHAIHLLYFIIPSTSHQQELRHSKKDCFSLLNEVKIKGTCVWTLSTLNPLWMIGIWVSKLVLQKQNCAFFLLFLFFCVYISVLGTFITGGLYFLLHYAKLSHI